MSLIKDIILNDDVCAQVLKPIKLCEQLSQLSCSGDPRLHREILPESPEDEKAFQPPLLKKQLLAVGSEHDVQVLEYKEGPREFYVEFLTPENEENLQTFKNLLDEMSLQPLKSMPAIGTKCIASIALNDSTNVNNFRVEVKSIAKGQIRVHLMDKGREMIVKLSSLFTTSCEKIFEVTPFAVAFSLNGLHNATTYLDKEDIDFYFRHITRFRKLKLTVKTSPKNGI